MFKKTFFLVMPAIFVIGSLHAQDRKSFSAEEIEQMRNQSVLEICVQKPENKHCKEIRSVLNPFQNSSKIKFAPIKGRFLPCDHARAILHFQTQDLGKIMGWDEDRIKHESNLLHVVLEQIAAISRQLKK